MKRNEIIAGILLGICGFALNLFRLPLFFNVDFLFGSIITMFALLRYGLWAGVICSLIASACTIIHWQIPWAIFIMTAEALAVGIMIRKKRMDLMLADAFYWFTIGAVLTAGFYICLAGFKPSTAFLLGCKLSVNGLLNSLVAAVIFQLFPFLYGTNRLPSLESRLLTTMQTMVLVPTFLIAYYTIHNDFKSETTSLLNNTARLTRITALAMGSWLQEEENTLSSLANILGSPTSLPAKETQQILERYHKSEPSIFRLGVMDREMVTLGCVLNQANHMTVETRSNIAK